jgi:hypothetical protein
MSALGHKRTICSAKGHVRFAPNSDRESGFPQTVMSALPPKADMCGANRNVRFGPEADIPTCANNAPLWVKSVLLMSAYPLAAVSGSPPSQRTIANNTYFLAAVPNEAIAF